MPALIELFIVRGVVMITSANGVLRAQARTAFKALMTSSASASPLLKHRPRQG